MALVLDAGALIGVERRDRKVGALLRVAQQRRSPVRTSAAVLAQVWRDGSRQANLARTLPGIDTRPLNQATGRRVGELLSRSNSGDVADGHVALLTNDGDTVLTSDVPDIRRLRNTLEIKAGVTRV